MSNMAASFRSQSKGLCGVFSLLHSGLLFLALYFLKLFLKILQARVSKSQSQLSHVRQAELGTSQWQRIFHPTYAHRVGRFTHSYSWFGAEHGKELIDKIRSA